MEIMSSKRFEYELRKIEIEMLLNAFGKLEELKEKILSYGER
jgi:hypothetical protein